jgi:TetR/AcrR family transcriptional repressor of nem operon
MKVSREQVAENRRRILDAAGRLFRERGFGDVTVAEVMAAAGLTHGGFYGHFKSKDELIAATLAEAMSAPPEPRDLASYAAEYLSSGHCADLGGGCATAALACDTLRQSPEARAEMTAGLQRQLEHLAASAPGRTADERRRAAIGSWSAMVGALILARVSDDPALSDEILGATRGWIAAAGGAGKR